MTYPAVLLASRSPRRRELLEQLGVPYTVIDVLTDEGVAEDETPAKYVERVARQKAHAGRVLAADDPRPVLAADTSVIVEDTILGQPASPAEATVMLSRLAGRSHQVLTAIVLDVGGEQHVRLVSTEVWFGPLTPAIINAYVATGEPMGKAGAYAIQGRAAAFITRIEGSYSAVVGLPLCELSELLNAVSANPQAV